MKICLITVILTVSILHSISGKIINGYEKDVAKALQTIETLRALLKNPHLLTGKQKQKIRGTLSDLTNFLVYHQFTDTMLQRFRVVAPGLYGGIDSLKDHRGRLVDVYVKFIRGREKSALPTYGSAMFSVSDDGEEVATSEYGRGTAAVTVWVAGNALPVLAHEFGHLSYMIPDLPAYISFYRNTYRRRSGRLPGHDCGDRGGRLAMKFESRFRSLAYHYRRTNRGEYPSPYVYLRPTRARIEELISREPWTVRATGRPIALELLP